MAQFEIKPLQEGLPFGIRLFGLTPNLAEQPEVRAEINNLFVKHGMILFEDVEQSDEMQISISTMFGPLKDHPVKAVARVDNDRLPGVIALVSEPGRGVIEVNGRRVSHWLPWHFDHCYNDELNLAGVLRSVERVEEGGLTGFMDGIALYQAFPADLRDRIEGTEIVYTLSTHFDHMKYGVPKQYKVIEPKPTSPEFLKQAASMSRAIHPSVWSRPSGEKVLHVSQYMAEGIVGQENPEGDALLDEVCYTIADLADQCSYHHKWEPGQMVIWDNTRMLHCVSGCRPEDRRLMYRTTIKGDYGLGRWETPVGEVTGADAMA